MGLGYQGRGFFANGLYWLFYNHDATNNWGYTWSADGSIWASYTNITTAAGMGSMAFTVVGTTVYYANGFTGNFRTGTLNGDGSITWVSAEVNTGVAGFGVTATIAIDSGGHAYIAWDTVTGVTILTNRTGLWTVDATILRAGGPGGNVPHLVSLSGGLMGLLIGNFTGSTLDVWRFNGVSWNQGTSTSLTYSSLYSDAKGNVVNGHDVIQCALEGISGGMNTGVNYIAYDNNTNIWSSPIAFTNNAWTYPTIMSIDGGAMAVGWTDYSTTSIVFTTSGDNGVFWSPKIGLAVSPTSNHPFNFAAFYSASSVPQTYNIIFDDSLLGEVFWMDAPLSLYTVIDTAHAIDFITTNTSYIIVTDSATATDSIILTFDLEQLTVRDKAYAVDIISVARDV
jgi:hypothetical protein